MNSKLPNGWEDVSNPQHFELELQKEISQSHVLFGLQVIAVAKSINSDDVVFKILAENSFRYALVHLSFSGKHESTPNFPLTKVFNNMESLLSHLKTQ